MPKKFKGENSKAADSRARKAAVQHDAAETKRKEAEDALWVDDDKQLAKKAQRKDDKEKRRLDQLERKKELAQLHDDEQESLKSSKLKPVSSTKVTRHQLDVQQQTVEAAQATERKLDKSLLVADDEPLVENLNRLVVEGEARNIDEAIGILDASVLEIDKNPEKRVKAAYQSFEDKRLPQLKAENPNLRISQIRQMLKKEWQKSPENPLNARFKR